ncbi:glycoside hydrolase family 15 protein [Nocardioides pinisoli]|uniref:Glycoside hydrolase family 15 protein n=1 Tax=Nocardioides pinisoli TaxID=2950279 RepID=A0ABT1L335_9ACTN|nr:glycoside hydrolase family 15 protein [Nocardioides pinisoli]MCP3424441.1 glycoside hydrolase family 15 protein [Nocardioides pinisoli]
MRARTPIEDYALIGDLHTAALISRDGSIDWLCLPRFDSAACFAALLDGPEAGHWTLQPAADPSPDLAPRATMRDYDAHSLVLRTRWDTDSGAVDVIDFMPPRGEAADVVRIVEGVRGSVDMHSTLRLRFDYGRVRPWVRTGHERPDTGDDRHTHEGARGAHGGDTGAGNTRVGDERAGADDVDEGASEVTAVGGPDAVWLHADVPMHLGDGTITSRFTVRAGDQVAFVLTHRASHEPAPRPAHPHAALRDTTKFWDDWLERCTYTGPWAHDVRRSLLLLKALTYAPTGGILAAATTSLPEDVGGVRNWDYRYCWLRDATFTLQALLGTGYTDEAKAWREWLVRAVAGDPSKLQIMYGLDGTPRLPETTLPWLDGYASSQPVRTGNAAAEQYQLDVWGETLDGLYQAREAGLDSVDTAWQLQHALLEWLEGHWEEPDNGLWEMRGPRRHFTHSKVMAWAGVDRAVRTVERHGLDGPADRWRALADRIHHDVCTHGYDADRNTFTQFYGSQGLDASLLLIPKVGFLPWSDERVVGTVHAVETELRRDGHLLRYDPTADGGPDGLPGTEAPFIACGFWLVEALHGIGQRDRAATLFDELLALRNDVGMLSEEYDPGTNAHLGNTPQAFSLVGLVNAALRLSEGAPKPARRPDSERT